MITVRSFLAVHGKCDSYCEYRIRRGGRAGLSHLQINLLVGEFLVFELKAVEQVLALTKHGCALNLLELTGA